MSRLVGGVREYSDLEVDTYVEEQQEQRYYRRLDSGWQRCVGCGQLLDSGTICHHCNEATWLRVILLLFERASLIPITTYYKY